MYGKQRKKTGQQTPEFTDEGYCLDLQGMYTEKNRTQ